MAASRLLTAWAERKAWFRPTDNARVARLGAMGGWDQLRARLVGDGDGKSMIVCFSTCLDGIGRYRPCSTIRRDPRTWTQPGGSRGGRVAVCLHVAAVDQDGEGEATGAGQRRLRARCAGERQLPDGMSKARYDRSQCLPRNYFLIFFTTNSREPTTMYSDLCLQTILQASSFSGRSSTTAIAHGPCSVCVCTSSHTTATAIRASSSSRPSGSISASL